MKENQAEISADSQQAVSALRVLEALADAQNTESGQ